MTCSVTSFFSASALGVGNAETLANYRARTAPGMREIAGDIPGRSIWFGSVPGELPRIVEREWNMRTNRLLKLAIESEPAFAALVAKYGAGRVGVVVGASNTGIDEAQGYVDRWLDEGTKPAEMDFSMIELGTPALYLKRLLGAEGPAYTV